MSQKKTELITLEMEEMSTALVLAIYNTTEQTVISKSIVLDPG